MTRSASPLLVLSLLPATCLLDEDPVLDLDLTTSCNRALIQPVVQGLLPDMTVYAAIVDDTASESGWALAREGTDASLLAVRFPDTSVRVELAGATPEGLDLQPGPISGQVWILEERQLTTRLWHLDASRSTPLVAYTSDLASFPYPGEDDWTRRLVFLGGSPHVAAIPSHSDDADTRVWVGRLTSSLHVDVAWEMKFGARCDDQPDPEICEADKATRVYPTIAWMAGPPDPRAPKTTLLLWRQEARVAASPGDIPFPEPEITEEDLAVVRLGRLGSGMPDGLLRSVALYNATPPFGVAVDDFGTYVTYGNAPDLAVWWLDDASSNTVWLDTPAPLDPQATLVQMDGDIALGGVNAGNFEIVKLFTDAPSFSLSTIHGSPAAPYVSFQQAGPGHVLLERETGAPDLVRVSCDEDSSPPGG